LREGYHEERVLNYGFPLRGSWHEVTDEVEKHIKLHLIRLPRSHLSLKGKA